ncbi:MAG: deoxyribonuclease IV [Methanotrichaceae archaeon]|nr:deoxyribonuclease IV [Methanotrichaceae archaeon]
MVRMGVHVSIAGGLDRAVDRAVERGCDVFQIFSRNPRGWRSKDLSCDEMDKFLAKMKASGMVMAVDHMPYLPNLASPKEDVYSKSVELLCAELERCQGLRIPYLVTHLGSHLGSGLDAGLRRIVGALDTAFSRSNGDVMLLLENTSGTKNSIGSSFEEIASIIDALDSKRLGVCLDTCHLFAAGYELRTPQGLRSTLEQFDNAIGLGMLKLVHLNDSRGRLGSKLDRHEHIGLGEIGAEGFKEILRDESIRNQPMILETPVDERRDDVGNLRVARALALTLTSP